MMRLQLTDKFWSRLRDVFLNCGAYNKDNLAKRVWEHKNEVADGFTSKYSVKKLVYYEAHSEIEFAIGREKRLKEWQRKWKTDLIEKDNPQWLDLYERIHF